VVRRGPLSGVNKIKWGELRDAYGPAEQIPGYLQMLTSPRPDDRDDGLFYLYMGICHQTVSLWEATPAVVPFLIALAGSERVRDRGRILDLLGHIHQARGHCHTEEPHLDEAERSDPEFRARRAEEERWEEETREAVRKGAPVYLSLLDAPGRPAQPRGEEEDEDAVLTADRSPVRQLRAALGRPAAGAPPDEGAAARAGALFVLSRLQPPLEGLQQRIEQRLLAERHHAVRLALILALGHLARQEPGATGLLRALAQRTDGDAGTELEAAVATLQLIHAAAGAVEAQHLQTLAGQLGSWRETIAALFRIDACDDPMAFGEELQLMRVVEALCSLEPLERLEPVWQALMGVVRGEDGLHHPEVARALLARVFSAGPAKSLKKLSPPQRGVARAIAENPAYFGKTNPIDHLLPGFGLPRGRKALLAAVG
jgi:hypothetical protein